MAIAPVSNVIAAGNPTTSFSLTVPAVSPNHLMILEFAHRGTNNGVFSGNGATGWNFKHQQLFATSTFAGLTYWKRAAGDEQGQVVTVNNLVNACAGGMTIYSGALTVGDALADATIVGEQNASGNETQAGITTSNNGAMVVLVVVNSPDVAVSSQAATSPVSLTTRMEKLSTGGTDASINHSSEIKGAAGATGNFTWAQTNGASGSYAYAISPAVATPYTADLTAPTIDFGAQAITRMNAYAARTTAASFAFTAGTLTRLSEYAAQLTASAFGVVGQLVTFSGASPYVAELTAAAMSFSAQAASRFNAWVAQTTSAAFGMSAQALSWFANNAISLTAAAFTVGGQAIYTGVQAVAGAANSFLTIFARRGRR